MVGTVVKSKIGELEEEERAGSSRRTSKELNGVVQGLLGKKRFLVRFQDGCKNNMSSNQLTIVIVENIPEEKEPEVFEIPDIPEEQVELEKGYYLSVYVMLRLKMMSVAKARRRRRTWRMAQMRRIWMMSI